MYVLTIFDLCFVNNVIVYLIFTDLNTDNLNHNVTNVSTEQQDNQTGKNLLIF